MSPQKSFVTMFLPASIFAGLTLHITLYVLIRLTFYLHQICLVRVSFVPNIICGWGIYILFITLVPIAWLFGIALMVIALKKINTPRIPITMVMGTLTFICCIILIIDAWDSV